MASSNSECLVRGIAVVLMTFAIVIDTQAGTVGRSTPTGFTDDFAAACAEAKKSGKKVLAVFSGSDWCHWCKALEMDYLSKREFVEEAKKDFVLVFIDSPKDKSLLSDVAKVSNEKLVEKYDIGGFPTIKVLKADGTEIVEARPTSGSTPEAYVTQLRRACTPEGRFKALVAEILRDGGMVMNKAQEKKFQSMLDLAGFLVEPLESVATNYMPRCRALRAEVEKADPSKSKEALLAKIDMTLDVLEKFRNHNVEGLADLLLDKLGNDDSKAERVGGAWSPLALSFVSASEFPGTERDVYGVRLNLLGGCHHDVTGIDVGGIYNSVSNGMYGVQVGGICDFTAHATMGAQISGLVNVGGWWLTGMQATGLINLAGDVCGAQVAGWGSLCLKMRGCQVSGGANLAGVGRGCQIGVGGNIALVMDGLQIGGELNSAYRMRGIQCSAIVNSGNILDGAQLSAINLSDDCSGVQIGAVNSGTDVAGLQVGVVNYANTMSGCQVGVLNVIKSSSVPVLPVVNMSF